MIFSQTCRGGIKMIEKSNKDLLSVVVMMCGVAGSGKTTYAQQLEKEGYIRLSIDEKLWSTYGRYGIDYPVEKYDEYSEIVEQKLSQQLTILIQQKKNVVIDFSFWQRAKRGRYKTLIEKAGGQWKLIYMKATPELLQTRLKKRSERFDANAAFPITDDILTAYLHGFEEPLNEGEIVIEQ